MPLIILLEKAADAAPPNWFVVVMGVGTVFIGLICIIVICTVMGLIFRNQKQESVPSPTPKTEGPTMENRQEILAAVCAVAAEESGTDVSALKVIAFKKL